MNNYNLRNIKESILIDSKHISNNSDTKFLVKFEIESLGLVYLFCKRIHLIEYQKILFILFLICWIVGVIIFIMPPPPKLTNKNIIIKYNIKRAVDTLKRKG